MSLVHQEFIPHIALQPYIEKYWMVKARQLTPYSYTKTPNGCTDILISLGTDFQTDKEGLKLKNECVYLAGLKTKSVKVTRCADMHIVGIALKAGAVYQFYELEELSLFTNEIVQQPANFVPDFSSLTGMEIKEHLDQFFLKKLRKIDTEHLRIVDLVKSTRGHLKVNELAKKVLKSERQIERMFKSRIGIGPKAFIDLVRFQHAYEAINRNAKERSLLEIAVDHGYYDHAHLSNAIKKYTGKAPTFF